MLALRAIELYEPEAELEAEGPDQEGAASEWGDGEVLRAGGPWTVNSDACGAPWPATA